MHLMKLPRINCHDYSNLLKTIAKNIKLEPGIQIRSSQLETARLLMSGCIVELPTGCGKSLAILLAAVHLQNRMSVIILTPNEVLADRDCKYAQDHTTAITIDRDLTNSSATIIYVTPRELAFAHLQNLITLNDSFLLIDEIDEILMDEADSNFEIGTPTLDSLENQLVYEILGSIALLHSTEIDDIRNLDSDCVCELLQTDIIYSNKDVEISAVCEESLTKSLSRQYSLSESYIRYVVRTVLIAAFNYHLNIEYTLKGDAVCILNGHTGFASGDSKYTSVIQHTLEFLNMVPLTPKIESGQSINYSQLVRHFADFSGCSGTAMATQEEIFSLYGKITVRLKPENPGKQSIKKISAETLEDSIELIQNYCTQHAGKSLIVFDTEELMLQASEHIAAYCISSKNSEEAININARFETEDVILSTAICGRGIDIASKYQLQVIQVGSMQQRKSRQLTGRTGRNGYNGKVLQIYISSLSRTLSSSNSASRQSWRTIRHEQREAQHQDQMQSHNRIHQAFPRFVTDCIITMLLSQEEIGIKKEILQLSVSNHFEQISDSILQIWRSYNSPTRFRDINLHSFLLMAYAIEQEAIQDIKKECSTYGKYNDQSEMQPAL